MSYVALAQAGSRMQFISPAPLRRELAQLPQRRYAQEDFYRGHDRVRNVADAHGLDGGGGQGGVWAVQELRDDMSVARSVSQYLSTYLVDACSGRGVGWHLGGGWR